MTSYEYENEDEYEDEYENENEYENGHNMNKKPTHRQHHRLHDYKSRCIYHITLVVSDRVPLFGRMVGATADEARVEFSPLGQEIANAIQMIPMMEARRGNEVQILGAATMPEHIHFVLFVRKPMKEKLGMIIRGFKQGCNKALRGWLQKAALYEAPNGANGGLGQNGGLGANGGLGKPALPNGETKPGAMPNGELSTGPNGEPGAGLGPNGEPGTMPNGAVGADGSAASPSGRAGFPSPSGLSSGLPSGLSSGLSPRAEALLRQLSNCRSGRILNEHALFEEDFDETRLRRQGQLKAMIAYVHNNPRHRWLKQHKPEWLCVTRGIVIAGRSYDAIGNVNLLALPRHQVHCRYKWERYNDIEARRAHQNECVVKARQNYALVSPFVSPHEAAVRDFCLKEGHSVIVLHNNGFTNFSQCPGGLYDYCVMGQVLVLVPSEWPHDDRKGVCSRQECVILNGYAEEIVKER